ncbi:hypothetical protein GQ457_01G018310 [Hibiscus cannabinus]
MYGVRNPVEDPASRNATSNDGFVARPRPIRYYLAPILDDLNPVILAPEFQATHLELNPLMFDMLNSIGKFGGAPHEDARQHIHAFFEHNPPKMHTQLRNDIASFRQADDESMFECWDRYKELLRNCTNHGFHDWTQVMMFYNSVNAPTRTMLDASANGTLLDKSPEVAFDILDRIANNDYQFHSSRLAPGRRTHERLDLDAIDSIAAQLSAITNMLKNLQCPSQVKEIPVASSSCALCYGIHHVNECPKNHDSANYMWNFNMSNENPCPNTYDLGWSQHPNFSWANQEIHNIGSSNRHQNLTEPPVFQQNMLWQNDSEGSASSSNINSLEATLLDFMTTTKALLEDHVASIKSQGALLQSRGTLLQSNPLSDTEVTKAQGKEKCSAFTLKEAKFGGETLGEPSHEMLHEESRLQDDSPSMESKGKGLMSGPNNEMQNIATSKDNPPPVGVDDQRVTINVFNTLKHVDDFRECQPLQDVESMMANEKPVEFCCINFSQIEDYLKLEDEDNNEIKEYQREVQQSSILIARPGSNETLPVNNAGHLSRLEIMKELRNEIEIKEEFPDKKLLFAAATLCISGRAGRQNEEKTKTEDILQPTCDPPSASCTPIIKGGWKKWRKGDLKVKEERENWWLLFLIIFFLTRTPIVGASSLGFLSHLERDDKLVLETRERDSLEPFKQWNWLMGVTTLTHFRDKDRVSTTKKSRT